MTHAQQIRAATEASCALSLEIVESAQQIMRALSTHRRASFVPRIHENGKICCSNPVGMCEKCQAHFGVSRAASVRTPVPNYAAPDPYESGLAALRAREAQAAAAARTHTPAPRPAQMPHSYAPPDPYAAGLAAMKKENR